MKKFFVLAIALIMVLSLAACGEDDKVPTTTTPGTAKTLLTSDAFEENWIGEWKCVSSEQTLIKKGDTVKFFDYDNKVDITTSGISTHWYVCYDATEKVLRMYKSNEFIEGASMWDYEISKETDTQITLSRTNTGDEIVIEK